MARDELTAIDGITAAHADALEEAGINTPMDLVLIPRDAIRQTLKAAEVSPVPSMGEIANWQDRARQVRLESPPAPTWEQEASFVVSFERRGGEDGEERQTVVALAESDVPGPAQLVERDWNPAAVGAWIGEQMGADGSAQTAATLELEETLTTPGGSEARAESVIRRWNAVALDANRVAHSTDGDPDRVKGPTRSSRALAIVHLAMHDAYFSITREHRTYLDGLREAPEGASPDAAAAAAAWATLRALHPSEAATFEDDEFVRDTTGGRTHGIAVAAAILAARHDDPDASGTYGTEVYTHDMSRRDAHRVAPNDVRQGYHGPLYGKRSALFAARERHRLKDPRKPEYLNPDEYQRAVEQVRAKGITPELTGTLPSGSEYRTPDETLVGHFWGYDGVRLGTPVVLYNQILRVVAESQGNSTARDARVFALVNVAMADAGVLAWADKYHFNFWRPVLGVREHDASMGPRGIAGRHEAPGGDPGWLPLGAPQTNPAGDRGADRPQNVTPPFPAYPSGHATFGAAAFQTIRRFYGVTADGPDDLLRDLEFVSDELDGTSVDERGDVRSRHVRSFAGGLWEMIEENGRSRVYLGVHWIFDAFAVDEVGGMDVSRPIGGVPLGLAIANDVMSGEFRASEAAGREA